MALPTYIHLLLLFIMKTVKEENMKRAEFLKSLGLSASTLMAFYCLGTTMTACGSKSDDPDPESDSGTSSGSGISGTTTGTGIDFTVDMTNSTCSSLKTTGGTAKIGDIIVALTNSGTYVALAKACTHQGTAVDFRASQNDFYCSSHGSEFSTTGAVEEGPATVALKAYTVTVSSDGNTLTVKA